MVVAACTAVVIDVFGHGIEQPPCGAVCRREAGSLPATTVELADCFNGPLVYRQSIALIQQLMQQRMMPLTMSGLEQAMRVLNR